jgi:hypothetical protein
LGEETHVADQYWLRVVGFLQPPPAREVLYRPGFYVSGNGNEPAPFRLRGRTNGDPRLPRVTAGDRLIYFAIGPFVLYALGTTTSDPTPVSGDPQREVVDVKTDVYINAVLKTPHFGGVTLPSGRDLRLLVEQYQYILLSPEDGQALVQRVQTKAGAKD